MQLKVDRKKILDLLEPFLSVDTGFLHLNPSLRPYKRADTIPLSTNFIYLLLLFRTKDRAYIEKALKALDHLLHFQGQEGASKGNFPVFLHQYPFCERYFEVIDSLFPLYWITKEFSHILNPDLRKRLHSALELGIGCIGSLDQGRDYSYLLTLQRATLTLAIGDLLNRSDWKEKGSSDLLKLANRLPQECWGSPRALSKMLIALELITTLPEEQSWTPFWCYVKKSWHNEMNTYLGPALSEHFEKDHNEGTLYHLYMTRNLGTKFHQNFSPITLLEGELVACDHDFDSETIDDSFTSLENYSWQTFQSIHMAYSYFNLNTEFWVKTGGYYPLKIAFKNEKQIDSFVLQMGTHVSIETPSLNKLLLTFDLQEGEELESYFFWNLSSKMEATIDGKKASAFTLDQPLELRFKNNLIRISFPDCPKDIWGQFMQRNRRTQLISENYQNFDGHLYFREIKALEKPFQLLLEIL